MLRCKCWWSFCWYLFLSDSDVCLQVIAIDIELLSWIEFVRSENDSTILQTFFLHQIKQSLSFSLYLHMHFLRRYMKTVWNRDWVFHLIPMFQSKKILWNHSFEIALIPWKQYVFQLCDVECTTKRASYVGDLASITVTKCRQGCLAVSIILILSHSIKSV